MRRPSVLNEEWVLQRVNVNNRTGCWLWRGAVVKNSGYARATISGHNTTTVSRLVYAMYRGEIGPGLLVCHDCDQYYEPGDITYRRCVNPDHLFLGTHTENVRDSVKKGRVSRKFGESNPQSKLTEPQVRLMLWLRRDHGVHLKDLSDWFGVVYSIAGRICRGERWTHVSRDFLSAPSNDNNSASSRPA